ncbi:metallophosphatase [Cellulophaga phage phi14:2]|uniref:Metallophosphatase n=1 Tax=Cellulophaga phage phi14:2 TaxID=1327990 RepID=S0A3E2_9CAUD|nr:metallophosphatase [Cellulophaga phage phi14:2]AGO48952.1 metallophosphatase [Cellulophaga phage phi14:2]
MSGTVRYISDPHKGHENMAKRRGFPDAYHQDENFIAQWNLVVNKKDTTWILGDLTMHKNDYAWLDRLNGYKRVILGNHDEGKQEHIKTLLNHVNSIHAVVKVKTKQHGSFWLSHVPIHPSELEYRADRNIHGHVHENSLDDKRYINVCAEIIDFPRTIEELIKINKLKV